MDSSFLAEAATLKDILFAPGGDIRLGFFVDFRAGGGIISIGFCGGLSQKRKRR
jgi:hypothetical protein